MSDPRQARELLEAAERDLSALRGMTDADIFADEIFGFHAQQAVEKSFKAWLALSGEEYPLTHNLSRLLEALRKRDATVVEFRDTVRYTPYAGALRHGGAGPGSKPFDRLNAILRVAALVERARRAIEGA